MNLSFSVWVTTACNLKCTYCYEGDDKPCMYLEKQQAERVVNYILKKIKKIELERKKKIEVVNIELHGGEPLINFQGLSHFVNTANIILKDYYISYQMTTNGTILNEEILSFLKQNIQNLTISMDGDKYTHDNYRKYVTGQGTYDRVKENSLKLLQVYGDDLRIRMTFNSDMVDRLSENVIHLLSLGFKLIIALPDVFDKKWNDENSSIIDREIKKIKSYDVDESVFINLTQPLLLQEKGICLGGYDGENIFPNGDIYPCTMAAGNREFYIGNIKDGIDPLLVESILKYSSQKIISCSECNYYKYCECVRCRIINKIANEDYYEPIGIQCYFNNVLLSNNGIRKMS